MDREGDHEIKRSGKEWRGGGFLDCGLLGFLYHSTLKLFDAPISSS